MSEPLINRDPGENDAWEQAMSQVGKWRVSAYVGPCTRAEAEKLTAAMLKLPEAKAIGAVADSGPWDDEGTLPERETNAVAKASVHADSVPRVSGPALVSRSASALNTWRRIHGETDYDLACDWADGEYDDLGGRA